MRGNRRFPLRIALETPIQVLRLPARRPRCLLVTLAAAGALAAASPAVAATITSSPPPLSNQDPTITWTADTVGGTFSWKLVNTGTGTTVAAGGGETTSAGPIPVGSRDVPLRRG